MIYILRGPLDDDLYLMRPDSWKSLFKLDTETVKGLWLKAEMALNFTKFLVN